MKYRPIDEKISTLFFEHEITTGFYVTYKIRSGVDEKIAKAALELEIEKETIDIYNRCDGLNYSWQQSKINQDNLVGKINILQLQYVIGSWEGNLYFTDEAKDSPLRSFHPIDEFSEEAHCGILLEGGNKQHMYFHYYGEDELIDLEIDFMGYLDLALEARGFFYWQKYLLEIIYGNESEESNNFKHFMPLLFDNFKLDAFNKKLSKRRL